MAPPVSSFLVLACPTSLLGLLAPRAAQFFGSVHVLWPGCALTQAMATCTQAMATCDSDKAAFSSGWPEKGLRSERWWSFLLAGMFPRGTTNGDNNAPVCWSCTSLAFHAC